MNVAITIAIATVLLFALAFATKRRFGVLGLALAAGAMLSELWAEKLTPFFSEAGLVIETPPLQTVIAVALVLMPALLLLFSGPSYQDKVMRVVGAACFAILAAALLIDPLGSGLVLVGDGREIYNFIITNKVYIVTTGLMVALIDILGVHTSKRAYKKH
ncbi:hypothetical protein H6796_02935 [Candidatus Nomurabacteria bacterium]|nr:hypothetical protein [Candidatus Nomurabacteria bacterium]